MSKPKIYIDGKEGTTGLQIYERLGKRDDVELLLIDEDKRKDTEERRKFLNAADIVFLCLPDAAAKEAVAKAAQCVVPMPEHFHMEIDFVKHHVAYSKSFYPGAALKDDKFVCFDSDDWYEVLRFCHFVLSDG